MKHIFIKYHINYQYFQNLNNYQIFNSLLLQHEIPTNVIHALWQRFTITTPTLKRIQYAVECTLPSTNTSFDRMISIEKHNQRLRQKLVQERQSKEKLQLELLQCKQQKEELEQKLISKNNTDTTDCQQTSSYIHTNTLIRINDDKSETASCHSFGSLVSGMNMSDQSSTPSNDNGGSNSTVIMLSPPGPIQHQRSRSRSRSRSKSKSKSLQSFNDWNSACEGEWISDFSSSDSSSLLDQNDYRHDVKIKENKQELELEDVVNNMEEKSNLDQSIYEYDDNIAMLPNAFHNNANLNSQLPYLTIFGVNGNLSNTSFMQLPKNGTMVSDRYILQLLNMEHIKEAIFVWIIYFLCNYQQQ